MWREGKTFDGKIILKVRADEIDENEDGANVRIGRNARRHQHPRQLQGRRRAVCA
jgi:hypothetical protein